MQPSPEQPPPPESQPDPAPDAQADELVTFYTGPLDHLQGSTSNRSYRAWMNVLGGATIIDISRRRCILTGQMLRKEADELMGLVHDQLKLLCAEPLMVWVGGELYWLGDGETPYVCNDPGST